MKERMNVYLTTGKKNLFYCYPAIHSFFKENQDSQVWLYMVSEDLEEADLYRERALAENFGHRIVLLHFDVNKARENIVCKDPDHWPLGTLGCYWMFHELLPADVDRILALEADTVTVGSVREYYHTDLNGYYAACPDPEHKPASHKRLMERLGGDTLTFVMSLYHVTAIRKAFSVSDILRTDAEVVEKYGHSQQELTFGILFRDKIKFLPGADTCVEENRQAMGEWGYSYIRECEKTCKVLHFSSFYKKEKPWNPVCMMPGYLIWWEYAKESPYYEQYFQQQWEIFDRQRRETQDLKKNITRKNILAMTLAVSFVLVAVAAVTVCGLSVFSALLFCGCFAAALLISLALRRCLIWAQDNRPDRPAHLRRRGAK